MQIDIVRTIFTDKSTIGDFIINNRFFSYSLEDKDRQWHTEAGEIIAWVKSLKIPKETAIPYGTYEVIINYSNRFKKEMPLLLNVPDYLGVRIHTGNYAGYEQFLMTIPLTTQPFTSLIKDNGYVEVYND